MQAKYSMSLQLGIWLPLILFNCFRNRYNRHFVVIAVAAAGAVVVAVSVVIVVVVAFNNSSALQLLIFFRSYNKKQTQTRNF